MTMEQYAAAFLRQAMGDDLAEISFEPRRSGDRSGSYDDRGGRNRRGGTGDIRPQRLGQSGHGGDGGTGVGGARRDTPRRIGVAGTAKGGGITAALFNYITRDQP